MAITESFFNAVRQNNILRIHIMLKDSLLVDKTFSQFREMISFAESKGVDIWKESQGRLKKVEKPWTSQILDLEMTKLVNDFTKERVSYVKEIIQELYPVGKSNQNFRENKRKRDNRETQHISLNSRNDYREYENKNYKTNNNRYVNNLITESFFNAVEQNNMLRVHIMLKDSLLVDKTFSQFDEMVRFAESKGVDIWKESQGRLKKVEKPWTSQILDLEMTKLVNDFTKERISYVKEIIRELYPVRKSNQTYRENNIRKDSNIHHQKNINYQRSDNFGNDPINAGIDEFVATSKKLVKTGIQLSRRLANIAINAGRNIFGGNTEDDDNKRR